MSVYCDFSVKVFLPQKVLKHLSWFSIRSTDFLERNNWTYTDHTEVLLTGAIN